MCRKPKVLATPFQGLWTFSLETPLQSPTLYEGFLSLVNFRASLHVVSQFILPQCSQSLTTLFPSPAQGKGLFIPLAFVEPLLHAQFWCRPWCLAPAWLVSWTDHDLAPASCTQELTVWPLASYSTSLSLGFYIRRMGMEILPTSVRYYPDYISLERRVSIRPSFPGSIACF